MTFLRRALVVSAMLSLLGFTSATVIGCGGADTPVPDYPPSNDPALEDTDMWELAGGESLDEEEEEDDWVDPVGDDEDDDMMDGEAGEAATEAGEAAGEAATDAAEAATDAATDAATE